MKIDLRKCKPGDKLQTSGLGVVTYERYTPSEPFPHFIRYENNGCGSRLNNGRTWKDGPHVGDITAILTSKSKPKPKKPAKVWNKRSQGDSQMNNNNPAPLVPVVTDEQVELAWKSMHNVKVEGDFSPTIEWQHKVEKARVRAGIMAYLSASAQPPGVSDEQIEAELSQAHRVIADLRAQLAAAQGERDHWKANHNNQVAIKSALMDRPDLRDRAAKVVALIEERDDLRMRLVKAVELLGEVKTRLYGHVPLANAQHIDLFRRICALLDATEQQRGDAGEATK
jgi:hypothetical protein